MGREQALRSDRLVFYEQDQDRLDGELDGFLELSGARCALLIDKDGHLVTRRGEAIPSALESISALIAGSFAATREMARLFGEEQFSTLFHQGQRESIQVTSVGDRALFAIVFDERTNLGMVRYYSVEATRRLTEVLGDIAERNSKDPAGGPQLASDFSRSAAAALDKLF